MDFETLKSSRLMLRWFDLNASVFWDQEPSTYTWFSWNEVQHMKKLMKWLGYNLQTNQIHISFLDNSNPSRNDFQNIKSIQFIPRWKCLAQEPAPPPGLGPLLGGEPPKRLVVWVDGFFSKFQVAPPFEVPCLVV